MLSRFAAAATAALAFCGCSTVYPEIATPVRPAPAGLLANPPPPGDMFFLGFERATIPQQTRDGRQWDRFGGGAPDPFGILFVNDVELFRTPVQADTLEPTWPDQKKANYRLPTAAKVRVELWDANPINNHPICVKELRRIEEEATEGRLEVDCNSGARVVLVVEPAHPRLGLGFWYELRVQQVFVTRTLAESPAARAGLERGDQILEIQGKDVAQMEEGEAQSRINANSRMGVTLKVERADGSTAEVLLKDGPIYPAADEDVKLE
jgi:hypothetical protein